MTNALVLRDVTPDNVQLYNKGLAFALDEFDKDPRIIEAGTITLADRSPEPTGVTVLLPSEVSRMTRSNQSSLNRFDMGLEHDVANIEDEAYLSGVRFFDFNPAVQSNSNRWVARQLTDRNIPREDWPRVQKMAFELTHTTPQRLESLSEFAKPGEKHLDLTLKPLDALWFLPETEEKRFRPLGRSALAQIKGLGINIAVSRARLETPRG